MKKTIYLIIAITFLSSGCAYRNVRVVDENGEPKIERKIEVPTINENFLAIVEGLITGLLGGF